MAHVLQVKRVYDPFSEKDGMRILVDRLWPRGISKEKAKIDLWLKDIAPTTELRKWFHKTGEWDEFKKRYTAELKENKKTVEEIYDLVKKNTVTFVYSAKNTEQNNAVVLKEFIESY